MSQDWTFQDSLDLYNVESWGGGFFSVSEKGSLVVGPSGADGQQIDLHSLVLDLNQRGLRSPMLIRFSDILAARVRGLRDTFIRAMANYDYDGRFRGVYPIKVNQQRHVVEEIIEHGASAGIGLEAGSKPELLVALALLDTPDALIICNGYKDRAYIETALLAQRLGRHPVIVIDRFRELELIIKTSRELGIRPCIGVRARLSARGAGKWIQSAGPRSKFGLTPDEIVAAAERLRSEDMLDCLELVHSHIGSQITSIQAHKEALKEVGRVYVGLHQMGARLGIVDVGGGLAVDYDGTRSQSHSSKNYSLQEYANDVVAFLKEACDDAGIPVPDIVTESGRAMAAHHSVLVFDVLEVNEIRNGQSPPALVDDSPKVLGDLMEVWEGVHPERLQEAYNDTQELREEATTLFSLGYLGLADRGRAERLALCCFEKILDAATGLEDPPEELTGLEEQLADTYYANFSIFQSAPDSWAVKQLFPVMPIHRLNERPTRRGSFADLTCDSDGKIDQFIGERGPKSVLELHRPDGQRYFIGVFLVGAYQEILGDLHNLFGDTDAVHVRLEEDGGYSVDHVVEGDDVAEVLQYVQYDPKQLAEQVRRACERALRSGKLGFEDAGRLRKHFAQGLQNYTYLEDE